MIMADLIPTLDDASLKTLKSNAERLASKPQGPMQAKAADLLPLIEAEIDARIAAKPAPKKAAAKRKPSAKALAAAAAAAAATSPD